MDSQEQNPVLAHLGSIHRPFLYQDLLDASFSTLHLRTALHSLAADIIAKIPPDLCVRHEREDSGAGLPCITAADPETWPEIVVWTYKWGEFATTLAEGSYYLAASDGLPDNILMTLVLDASCDLRWVKTFWNTGMVFDRTVEECNVPEVLAEDEGGSWPSSAHSSAA